MADRDNGKSIRLIFLLLIFSPFCGNPRSGADFDTDDGVFDVRPEFCYLHPNTCNTGGRGIQSFDCCSYPEICCNLCFPPEECGAMAECLEKCPVVIPCEGIPDSAKLSCYYDPEDFTGTAYCPVYRNPAPSVPQQCSTDCPTGVICRFEDESFGDAALCCPENWFCSKSALYNLPVCSAN